MALGGLAIAIGLALLIVPRVVLMGWWMYALFFLVDQKMAFTEAMGASKLLVSRSGFRNHLVILLITAVLNRIGGGLGGLGTPITAHLGCC